MAIIRTGLEVRHAPGSGSLDKLCIVLEPHHYQAVVYMCHHSKFSVVKWEQQLIRAEDLDKWEPPVEPSSLHRIRGRTANLLIVDDVVCPV